MARVESAFVLDPQFERHLMHFDDTLNPVGDVVRSVSNKIARKAKSVASQEARYWQGIADSLESKKRSKNHRATYLRAKALAYSLRKYANLTVATMEKSPRANYGAVWSGHAASLWIEYGGPDNVLKVGEDRLIYPQFSILRRALNG